MDFFTHIVISIAISHRLIKDENKQHAFIIGGMAPDFDILVSWLPNLIPELFILQHRGLFHTIFVAPLIVIALIFSTNYYDKFDFIDRLNATLQEMYTELNSKTVFWGILGSILHLLMDCITQGGLYLFFPFYSQRVSFGIISIFDPFVTLLSGFVVIRFLYNKLYKSYSYSLSQIEKSAKFVGILFLSLLIVYGLLQTYTITTHSPTSTSPNVIPIFRWILIEDNNVISIQLVNQLTQSILKTYNYTTLSFNRTSWNSTLIYSVVERAKSTLDYEKFEFELGSETRTAISVKFHEEKNKWEVRIIDSLRDAQHRYYGLPRTTFMESEIKIYVDSFDQT